MIPTLSRGTDAKTKKTRVSRESINTKHSPFRESPGTCSGRPRSSPGSPAPVQSTLFVFRATKGRIFGVWHDSRQGLTKGPSGKSDRRRAAGETRRENPQDEVVRIVASRRGEP